MTIKEYAKNCPICNEKIIYCHKETLTRSIKNNMSCKKCGNLKTIKIVADHLDKNENDYLIFRKWCNGCKSFKDIKCFNRNKSTITKLSNRCKKCNSEYKKKMEVTKEWSEKRRRRWNKWIKIKKNRDRKRLIGKLSGRIRSALKRVGIKKSNRTSELLGCNIYKLKTHLQSKFSKKMSWDNCGENGWHIDHIIPCRAFNLLNEEEQKKCFHYTNLQPLWNTDNHLKSDLMPNGERARDLFP